MDGGPVPPRVVGIVSLGESENTEEKLHFWLLIFSLAISKSVQ
jgi:hypothetical protein